MIFNPFLTSLSTWCIEAQRKMHANIDLRHAIPPLISMCFTFPFLLDYDPLGTYNSSVKMAFLLFIFMVTFVFLFISIKLPLRVTVAAEAIHLKVADFSAPVAIALLFSIFLQWSHFWIAYSILVGICSSPWYCSLSNQLGGLLYWFSHNLQATPTLNISWFTQQHELPEQQPSSLHAEVEIQGNLLQPNLQPDFEVVIDE